MLRARRIAVATRLDRRRILRYNHNHTSMIPDRIGCELAVLTILCVLMIFFFPLMQGPYSVVHGPATALQAARAAARLQIIIVQGALNSLGNFLISPSSSSLGCCSHRLNFARLACQSTKPSSVADSHGLSF